MGGCKAMDFEEEDRMTESEYNDDDRSHLGGTFRQRSSGGLGSLFRGGRGRRGGTLLGSLLILAVVIMSIVQLTYSFKTQKDFMEGNTTQAATDFKVVINITYIFLALGIISLLLFLFGFSRSGFLPIGSGGVGLGLGRSAGGRSEAYISSEE